MISKAAGGGGAGGRIALYYDTYEFTGTISVAGGSGAQYGEIGTVWLWPPVGQLDSLEGFEDGWPGWYADNGLWGIGAPTSGPGSAHSGASLAGTALTGNCPSYASSRLVGPVLVVPGAGADDRVLVRYWQWFRCGNGRGEVQISVRQADGSWTDWAALDNTTVLGDSDGWERAWVDLSGYAGQSVRLAFYYKGGSVASSGWYIDDIELSLFTPPTLAIGEARNGSLADGQEKDYYVVYAPPGGHLMIALDDWDDLGSNELYVKHGAIPTAGDFDYCYADFGAADQQVYVPDAKPGYWFIMVCSSYVPAGGSAYTIRADHVVGVALDSVTPDHYGAAAGARLTIEGAGFTPETEVELVHDGAVVATATTVDYFSGRRIAADFNLTGLTPGNDYVLRVRVEDTEDELPFTVAEPVPAELRTNMVLPRTVGYHQPATIWVEYENVGEVAMEAPLLVVSAKQGERSAAILCPGRAIDVRYGQRAWAFPLSGQLAAPQPRGFWTSAMPEGYANTVQFLASGTVPGLLQPGEKGRFPVYWAGWQQPWDFAYPDIIFTLGVVEDTNADPIDWTELKDTMRPDSLDEATWDALWQAFTSEAGSTWGSYLDMLQHNAVYLGRQGLYVNDVSDLLGFEFAQADGLNVIHTLAASTDAYVVAQGPDISFERTYGQSISSRYALGAFGRGWSHNWDYHLELEADGTIRLIGPGGSQRTYQPDSRPNHPYFSMEGDFATFEAVDGGYRQTESGGYIRFFDSAGLLSYVEDTNGNRINCFYAGNQLTRLEHSPDQFLDIGWTGDRITSVTDPDARTTTYTYDASGEYLLNALFYDGSGVSYTYETAGTPARKHALTSITFPGNTHQYFNWDANGRLSGISRDGGAEPVAFTYGDAGEVYITDAFGNTSSYYLNQDGMLVRAVDPQDDTIGLTYDADYNLTSIIDPAGRSYNYVYDAEGNLVRMTNPLGYVTRLSYSGPYDRLTALVDANGNITRYGYNTDGDLTSIVYDDGSIESWTYDAFGNADTWTNRRGTPIGYEYDDAGRLTAKVYDGGSRVEYYWDDRGNLDYTIDASGTTDFTYDANDFLTRIDYPGGHWLEYTWNEAGQRTSLTNELGDVQYYHYDAAGRLESMTDEAGGLIVRYEYDAAGRLMKKTLGNGVYTSYAYDDAWQLTCLSNRMPDHTILSQFEYEYDSRGRRIAMTSTYGQPEDPRVDYEGRWVYEYDDLGQLIAWTDPTGHYVEYVYDGLGNRITVTEDGAVTAYTTSNLNQYTQVGDTTYTFDLDGNLAREDCADGSWTVYTYNDENRLTGIETSDGDFWAYGYNALGYRNSITEGDPTIGGVTETHIIDPFDFGDLVTIHSSAATTDPTTYTHGFGLVSKETGVGSTIWFSFDAIGSVQDITLDDAYVDQLYVYEPSGAVVLSAGTLESLFGAFGLYGVQGDAKGMLHMRAREYSTATGGFTSADPIGLAGGSLNLYGYAKNEPTTSMDPTGLGGSRRNTSDLRRWAKEVVDKKCGEGYGTSFWHRIVPGPNRYMRCSDWQEYIVGEIGGSTGHEKVYRAREIGRGYSIARDESGRLRLAGPGEYYSHYFVVVEDSEGRRYAIDPWKDMDEPVKPFEETDNYELDAVGPGDPNIKSGPAGFSDQHFVALEDALGYRVYFENDETATAPAQVVGIFDQLDADLDWTTFTVTEVGFGDVVLGVPGGSHHYQNTLSMSYDDVDFEVEIEIGIDLGTGEVYANFYSIDPLTGLPPEANVGFLPPDIKDADGNSIDGRGQGYFSYTIRPRADAVTGTEIRNVAYITFDGAQTVATNQIDPHDPSQGTDPAKECLVTVDADAPASAVDSLPAESRESFPVAWCGDDVGSGIATYDVFVSVDGGPYALWLDDTTETSAIYTGQLGSVYAFYSVATDNVGLVEDRPPVPDAATTVTERKQALAPGERFTFPDTNGDTVTIYFRGRQGLCVVSRMVAPNERGDATAITVVGSNERSSLTITVRKGRGAGDGGTTVGDIDIDGSFRSISASKVSLVGNLTVEGVLERARLDDIRAGHEIQINTAGLPVGSGDAVRLTFDSVADTTLDTNGLPISYLTATEWLKADGAIDEVEDRITAPYIGRIMIKGRSTGDTSEGNFEADLALDGADRWGYVLGRATVAGTIACQWDLDTGKVGTIKAGSTAASWVLDAEGYVSRVQTTGDLLGQMTADSFGTIYTRADLSANITATGYHPRYLTSIGTLYAKSVDNAVLDLEGGLKTARIYEWTDDDEDGEAGSIEAGWLGSIYTRRSVRYDSDGDFEADVTVMGQNVPSWRRSFGTARFAGDLLGCIDVEGDLYRLRTGGGARGVEGECIFVRTTGDMKYVSLAFSEHADFLAGVKDTGNRYAETGDDFLDALAAIKSFTIRGVRRSDDDFFVDTTLSAGCFGRVRLRNVVYDVGECGLFVKDSPDDDEFRNVTCSDVASGNWVWPVKPGKVFAGPADFIHVL